jgi:hypothetical protein
MAIMLPSSPHYYETGSPGEAVIYGSLEKNLDDSWIAIHSFKWIKILSSNGRKAQGEGDFVLFNPHYGILVIEVKSGDIEYHDHEWFTTNKQIIQDPMEQANDTKFYIIGRLKLKKIPKVPVFHSVWFPDVEVDNDDLPANYNKKIVFDKKTLKAPVTHIEEAFDYWYQLTGFNKETIPNERVEEIKKILKPQLKLIKVLNRLSEDINELYVRLNNEQAKLLENLEMCKEVSVRGRAGTGKTLLAIEKARRDSESGKSVLLLCFNTALSKRIKETLGETKINVRTVHSFALEYMKKYYPARVQGTFETDSDFEYLMSEFTEVTMNSNVNYDSIIIDEGQDFEREWISSIQDFGNKESAFYIFYDPYQHLYSSASTFNDEYLKMGVCYLLLRNMRNTDEISKSCLNIINEPLIPEHFSNIIGRDPEVTFVYNKNDLEEIINSKVHELQFINKIDRDDLTILSLDSWISNDPRNSFDHKVTTVRKFKGLENEFIIIADVNLSHLLDPAKQRLLYVALSRAKVHVILMFKIDKRYQSLACNKFNCSVDELPNTITNYIIRGSYNDKGIY